MTNPAGSLSRHIEAMIDQTTIIDPHTHIRSDQPNAPDLASLMSYHWVKTELIAVGMPKEDLDPTLAPDERVRRSLPFLKRMRNTAMSWCFHEILRGLYDFQDPYLNESNYREVMDRVSANARTPNWVDSVLKDRCRIETYVTSLGNRSEDSSKNRADCRFMLDAHYLFCPGVATDLEPYFHGRINRGEYGDALRDLFGGEEASSAADLERRLCSWLDGVYAQGVRFTNVFIPIEQRFESPVRSRVDRALSRARASNVLADDDLNALIGFVTWTVLAWHHEHHRAFQIAVGAEYFICDGKSIPRFQQNWTSEMTKSLHNFPNARFDLMMASDVMSHEIAVVARQFPNIYSSGYWWHNFFPSTISRTVSLRMQIAPMTKWSGFLCDAYYVEWTYGKLQVVKKAMSSAMAGLVEDGFYREDDLPPILEQVLHHTPRDLYDLA